MRIPSRLDLFFLQQRKYVYGLLTKLEVKVAVCKPRSSYIFVYLFCVCVCVCLWTEIQLRSMDRQKRSRPISWPFYRRYCDTFNVLKGFFVWYMYTGNHFLETMDDLEWTKWGYPACSVSQSWHRI